MITRLEVDGFKSLRDFDIDFEPFTVLVGPNGAGKSNILEALGLISRLGEHRAPEDALKQGRGRAGDQFVGENVGLPALRRLPGFRTFEDELVVALRAIVRPGATGK